MVDREFDGLYYEVVTFQVPSKIFGCDQMCCESTESVLILNYELCCLVNVGTLVVCRKFFQGHVPKGCVRSSVLSPRDVDDLGKLDRSGENTGVRDLVCMVY